MEGVPQDWSTVEEWLDETTIPDYPEELPVKMADRKYKDIPLLDDYSRAPADSFWSFFPKRALPVKAETRINARNLEKLVDRLESDMTKTQVNRARKVVRDLRQGANAYQKTRLPPITVPNTKSALDNGALITDKIAGWIEQGFVAGPFDCPPTPGFRVNPLMAIVRNGKVRPVLNMSGPAGRSFNDNVDTGKLERVHMDNAKKFGYKLKECGKGAVFSKFDFCDAYKTIPTATEDYRLQGFCWLGKYFVETQQTFGGIPSVCNFDREGNTVQTLTTVTSKVPRNLVFRILDDTSIVCKQGSGHTRAFSLAMERICKEINMPLAPPCPAKEKAFVCETRGVVMGIGFDSSDLSWFLPKDKADRVQRRCLDIFRAKHIDLKQLEKAMGSVNDMAQMATFARFFKGYGNAMVAEFKGDYDILKPVQDKLRRDMLVLAKIASSGKTGLPIPSRPCKEPLSTLNIYSDAAGASFSVVNGERVYHSNNGKGVACIGGDDKDNIWAWSRLDWPEKFLISDRDGKGKFFGSKTTTLESVGLLLPFISFPELICGKFVKFHVDNIAVKYGWENGHVKFDEVATEILRCVHILASYLGTKVTVKHVPRMSVDLAELADKLSRKHCDSWAEPSLFKKPGTAIVTWLNNPAETKGLTQALLQELKTRMTYI